MCYLFRLIIKDCDLQVYREFIIGDILQIMSDEESIPTKRPVQATGEHNDSDITSTSVAVYRDFATQTSPPLTKNTESHDGKSASDSASLPDEANIDMSDQRVLVDDNDDNDVAPGNGNNQQRTSLVYLIRVAVVIATVGVAVSPLIIAFTRSRIIQYLQGILVDALDLIPIFVTSTRSPTLLGYLLQTMRRPVYRLNPARVLHLALISTSSIRVINQNYSRIIVTRLRR